MPTVLGMKQDVRWRGKPPQMLDTDIPVWYRFLDKYKFEFSEVYYNTQVGGIDLTEEERKDPIKRSWAYSISKRIDVLTVLGKEVWIIEVARDPGLRAVGQLRVYQSLWLRDPIIDKIEKLVIVCERIDPDLLDSAGMQGFLVFVV